MSAERISLLTASEVAELLGVTTSWVYEQSRQGRIPTVTLGRYRRYRLEAIAEWVERRETDGGRLGSDPPHRSRGTNSHRASPSLRE